MKMTLGIFLVMFYDVLRTYKGEGVDSFVHERLYGELSDHVHTLSGLLSVLRSAEDREAIRAVESLYGFLNFLVTAHENRQRTESENVHILMPPTVMNGRQGRPQYSIFKTSNSSPSITWNELAVHCHLLRNELSHPVQAQATAWCSVSDIYSTLK